MSKNCVFPSVMIRLRAACYSATARLCTQGFWHGKPLVNKANKTRHHAVWKPACLCWYAYQVFSLKHTFSLTRSKILCIMTFSSCSSCFCQILRSCLNNAWYHVKHRVNLLINEYEIRDENKMKHLFSHVLYNPVRRWFLPCHHQHSVLFHFQCSKNWECHHCFGGNEVEFILCTKPAFGHAFCTVFKLDLFWICLHKWQFIQLIL